MASESERQDNSRRIIDRVSREAGSDSSLLARTARRSRDHLAAGDADQHDGIELWGTRIGRIAGLIITVGLIVSILYYVFGGPV